MGGGQGGREKEREKPTEHTVQGKLMVLIWGEYSVGSKCNHIHFYRRKAEGSFAGRKRWRRGDHGGRDWRNVTLLQGMWAATRNWKRRDYPQEPAEGVWS